MINQSISEFTVGQCLANLKYYAMRITTVFREYSELDQKSEYAITLMESMRGNINDYTQVFKDLLVVICNDYVITELNGTIRAFVSKFNPKEPELSFVNFLVERNSLVHEYYNREFLDERVRIVLSNYLDGALGVVQILGDYVKEKGISDLVIKKGRK